MSAPTTRQLGAGGPLVAAIGLGCMGMSGTYAPVEDAESIATIRAALDAGVTLLDTGDFYGMGHNELLIREALSARERGEALLSVKFGALRGPGSTWGGTDARPEAVRNFLAYSLRRLGTDHIDIYRPARLDPSVPIEETAPRLCGEPTRSTRSATCSSSTRCWRVQSRRRCCPPRAISASP